MLDEKYINILYKIVNTYGKEAQVLQTIEEMSELTKELLKNINRDSNNITDITLEVSDVIIMIMQLNKLLRQNDRMKK